MGTVTSRNHQIGELCTGGDWACAHGDVEALQFVVAQLAEYIREPLHCEVIALAEACASDPERATELWGKLKEKVLAERAP